LLNVEAAAAAVVRADDGTTVTAATEDFKFENSSLPATNRKMDRFLCVLCHRVYVQRGRWEMPRCPSCGCLSSVFPEWLRGRRAGH
jgi:hypothetical protein